LKKIEIDGDGFYAWGGHTVSDKGESRWDAMTRGDVVMGVHSGSYQFVSQILDKFDNQGAASALWGPNADSESWRLMFFFSKPRWVSRKFEDVADYLDKNYYHITRITSHVIARIECEFGSIEAFIDQRIAGTEGHIELTDLLADPSSKPDDTSIDDALKRLEVILSGDGEFDALTEEDARERALRSLVIRQGQPAFRRKLLLAYGGQCAVTGFDSEFVLEAAHIIPYRGEHTNDVTNGLLLRADIHSLFDCGKIGVHPDSKKIILSESLTRSKYKYLARKELRLPSDPSLHPNAAALTKHLDQHGLLQ
jgi:hypothetical protein